MEKTRIHHKPQKNALNQGGIKEILLPTDFSEAAANAFVYTLYLAEQLQAKIHLLHVYPTTHLHEELLHPDFVENMNDAHLKIASSAFEKYQIIAKEHLSRAVDFGFMAESGTPYTEIIRLSKELNVDLIVMGTQGAASINERILGSVTVRVIQEATCPVLAIPAEYSYQPIEQILYAMEMNQEEYSSVTQLINIARQMKAKILCANVQTKHTSTKQAESAFVAEEAFMEHFSDLQQEGMLEFHSLQYPDIIEGLRHFINVNKVDFIAMTTHKRDWVRQFSDPSLTREMVLYTDMPLLAFHK